MRAHLDTLIANLRAEVLGVPDSTTLVAAGTGMRARPDTLIANLRAEAAKGISLVTAVSVEESGHLGLHVAQTAEGTYLMLRSQAASLSYTETPSNLWRPEWGYNPTQRIGPIQVLGNIPLGIHIPGLPPGVGVGVDVWLQGIGSLGPGTRIVQELDRTYELGMRIGGSGPRFFTRRQDKLPTDPQGNPLVREATPIIRLDVFAYLSANLVVFVPGLGPIDVPGMWPNLTAGFTGFFHPTTGKVTWGGELSPALVSNADPRDGFVQASVHKWLHDDVQRITNITGTTPDLPLTMSTIALVQGPALPLDWMVKWMEQPLTRLFKQYLPITPEANGAEAVPEPTSTVPLAAGPQPNADNPIIRALNPSIRELSDEIAALGALVQRIDKELTTIPDDADIIRAIEEQAEREIAAARAAINKWNASPPAPPGAPPPRP
jgi:hypothetical protein